MLWSSKPLKEMVPLTSHKQKAVNHRLYQSSTMTAVKKLHLCLEHFLGCCARCRSKGNVADSFYVGTNWPRFSTLDSRYGSVVRSSTNGSELTHFRSSLSLVLTAWQASEGDNRDNALAIIISKSTYVSTKNTNILFISSNKIDDFCWAIHYLQRLKESS